MPAAKVPLASPPFARAEAGRTSGLHDLRFVERARRAADAVGRFVAEGGSGRGTFFMISPRLLITNHHVVPDADAAGGVEAEFGYELDEDGGMRPVTRFGLDPGAFFVSDGRAGMDFTVLALGGWRSGPAAGARIGVCPLPRAGTVHGVGSFVNIIQHPYDMPKQIAVRENRVVGGTGTRLVYTADTLRGSSGSPVFNDEWKVVALHHWGGETSGAMRMTGEAPPERVNEGIRASAIVRELRARRGALDPARRALLDEALGG